MLDAGSLHRSAFYYPREIKSPRWGRVEITIFDDLSSRMFAIVGSWFGENKYRLERVAEGSKTIQEVFDLLEEQRYIEPLSDLDKDELERLSIYEHQSNLMRDLAPVRLKEVSFKLPPGMFR